MDIWSVLEENLIRYRDVSIAIKRILDGYEEECHILIQQIKGKNFEESQTLFDSLYDIQGKLATALYKYDFTLNESLRDFVYHFDRDDIYSRKHWYQRFNSGMEWPNEE
ncbi:hypothetical protein J0B02_17450 [Enterobacteriaceae bacterium YMB-R22]|jgi:hypothetical protein|uniref:hypothetical protein n=1 Tax=Tenebrionicola larvae TaxID=2815733 RepID=UPI002010CDA9|nr:hypothetical protein [Tenebrionicola larvae]MBV4414569.1 hypothetical protein [Tenebrionicola larvae]